MVGVVVDESGAPVAGASVSAAIGVVSDGERVLSPIMFGFVGKTVTADAHGRFAIPDARGYFAAQAGDARSIATKVAARVRLVVRPTSRIEGTVALGATPPGSMWAVAAANEMAVVAPVHADGTFVIDRVPRGKVRVAVLPFYALDVASGREIEATAPVERVTLAVGGRAKLVVIARSADFAAPDMALAVVFRGRHAFDGLTFEEASKRGSMVAFQPAFPVAGRTDLGAEPDDFVAELASLPAGEITACGVAMSKKLLASAGSIDKMTAMTAGAKLGCAAVKPDDTRVRIELPPLRRPR